MLRRPPIWLLLACCGAVLFGLSAVVWVASNWAHWGALERLGLAGALLVSAAVIGRRWPVLIAPVGWFVWLGIGAWLALFGQIYQTSADPWQLFAWWAALSLPLVYALKSDALGAAWVLVLHLAVQLFAHAHGLKVLDRQGLGPVAAALGWGLWLLPLGVSALLQSLGWLGPRAVWTWRTACMLWLGHAGWAAVGVIFWDGLPWDVLLTVAGAVWIAWRHRAGQRWDAAILCAALGVLAGLLMAGAGRALLSSGADWIGALFLLAALGAVVFGALIRTVRTQWHQQSLHERGPA